MSTVKVGAEGIHSLQNVIDVISRMNSDKREKLEEIWKESKKHEPYYWPDCKDIRLLFNNDDEAISFINSIGGMFVTDDGRVKTGGAGYKLTLWGMLACPSVTMLIEPAVRVIEHVRACTKQKDFPIVISDAKLCEIAQIDIDTLEDLRHLFSRCDDLRSLIISDFNLKQWTISMNDSVTRSRNFESATACFCKMLEDEHKPWMIVHAADRKKREWDSVVLDRKKVLELVIRYLSLEDAIYVKIKHRVTTLVVLLAVVIPGMIAGIAGLLLEDYRIALGGYVVAGSIIGLLGWVIDIVKEKRKRMENIFVGKFYRNKMRKLVTRFISNEDSSLKMVEETRKGMEGFEGLWSWRQEMLTADTLRFYVSSLVSPLHRDFAKEELEDDMYWEIR